MRHRGGAPPPEDDDSSSSSSDDDAFAALSSNSKGTKKKGAVVAKKKEMAHQVTPIDSSTFIPTATSTATATATATETKNALTKLRHHGTSDARKAKLDALLQELQETKQQDPASYYGPGGGGCRGTSSGSGSGGGAHTHSRPLEKMGSYVEPGEEHLTTNVFVGNLHPSVTEEELTDLFRQFGDLYSVKIMWPRTEEERARNRNTGFVCFMERDDAQDAMDAFCDSDPMNTGRRMMLRWGKNVKKSVKRGTGGVPIPPIRKRQRIKDNKDHTLMASNTTKYENENENENKSTSTETFDDLPNKRRKTSMEVVDSFTLTNASTGCAQHTNNTRTVVEPDSSIEEEVESSFQVISKLERPNTPIVSIPKFDPTSHAEHAVRVVAPSDPKRLAFITTVASFVAKDGTILERKLMERESNNPDFSFLTEQEVPISDVHDHSSNQWKEKEKTQQEQIFYRWRIFAFAQGDGFKSWRTEPFVMIQPHGCFWIPPSLDQEEASREEEATKLREEEILSKQEERRRITSDTNSQTFMTGRQLEHAKFGKRVRSITEGDKLTDEEQIEWKDILSNQLCASRQIICEAMSFCFDKSFAATQISSILKDAILEDGPSISIETRIARLFLLSDILFNSQQPGVRNAFRYRDAVESMAPAVFTSLGKHGQGMAGRMTMNKLRTAVSSVLSAWTNWSVYNHTFLDELHAHFEGRDPAESSKQTESSTEKDTEVSAQDPSDESSERDDRNVSEGPRGDWSEVKENSNKKPQGEFVHAEDADGEPLDEDEDLDGEALDECDDVEGEALDGDDDIDGVALEDEDDDFDGDAISGDYEITGEDWTGM